jgi:hypothetical protein
VPRDDEEALTADLIELARKYGAVAIARSGRFCGMPAGL